MDEAKNKEVKKLVRKAELTRYMHGRLAERRGLQRNLVQVSIAMHGMLVSISAAVYYRFGSAHGIETVWMEGLLFSMIILPLVATTVVILDATVWRFGERENEHKSAVSVWGNWIRRAHEWKSWKGADLDVGDIQKKYRKCMKITSHTSMRDFIRYKKEWKKYLNESSRLDQEQKGCRHEEAQRNNKRDGVCPR